MEDDSKKYEEVSKFQIAYKLWLKKSKKTSNQENMHMFCQIWNDNIRKYEIKSQEEFIKELEKEE